MPVSVLSTSLQGFHLRPPPIADHVPLFAAYPYALSLLCPSLSPPTPSPDSFLLPPKWDRGIFTWAFQFVDLIEYCGLNLGEAILLFLVNIHLLESKY